MKENAINIENYHTPKEFKKVIDFNLLPLFFTKEIQELFKRQFFYDKIFIGRNYDLYNW